MYNNSLFLVIGLEAVGEPDVLIGSELALRVAAMPSCSELVALS